MRKGILQKEKQKSVMTIVVFSYNFISLLRQKNNTVVLQHRRQQSCHILPKDTILLFATEDKEMMQYLG
jgi:hypothetical protein